MKTCKFHKDLRGTTYGSDAIHHPCGCSVLTTDMEKHNEDPYVGTVCGGVAHCYFCDLMTIVSDEVWTPAMGPPTPITTRQTIKRSGKPKRTSFTQIGATARRRRVGRKKTAS